MTNATAPLNAETRNLLSQISTATLATQLFKRGLRQCFLVGLTPLGSGFAGFVGVAATMRHIAAREDIETLEGLPNPEENLQWQAVENIEQGQVLVIDSRDDVSAASMGDMLVTRLQVKGAAAVITDGAFRDGPVIANMGFPAYARASTATTRLTSFHVADLNVPVSCAGVAVYPGDILVGDREGVIVIPHKLADEVARDGIEQERREAWLHKKILAGAELWGTYPPNAETLAEWEAYKKANPQ